LTNSLERRYFYAQRNQYERTCAKDSRGGIGIRIGYARLDTTLIYARADTEQKRRAIAEATPPDSPLKEKLNAERFTVNDEDILKRLYGLR